MKKTIATLATLAAAATGAFALTGFSNGQALAEAQAEYDAFDAEIEDVWGLLVELDVATANGLTYAEHDDLTDDVTSEFARLDVDGSMAEGVVDDIERVIEYYGDANMAWNGKIYGDESDIVAEADLQDAWADAEDAWGDVKADVDAWETSLENGELPESADTI